MKIYTNEGNPFGLKLQILAKLAKCEVTVEKIGINDDKTKNLLLLPTLELDSGLMLFSTNAAAKYFFPDEGEKRDEWLEWSVNVLAPTLVNLTGVGHHANPHVLPILNILIKKLEDRLKSSSYLAGNSVTAADISVWSLLTPDNILNDAKDINCLSRWCQNISDLPEVQEITQKEPIKSVTFNALQNSNRYGGCYHIPIPEIAMARKHFVCRPPEDLKEPRTVLPKPGEKNVLITSALPYVNNVPHLGNIIGCVLSADIFARYCRAAGYNTLFISGTDEYGTATENKALAEKLTPKEICDKYFELHNSIYRWFGIGFDYFGRTTTQEQTEIVQEAFKDLYNKGFINTESVEQLLCEKCDRFLADRFVEGACPHPGCGYEDARGDQCDKCGKLVNATDLIRPRCKVCNTAPVIRSSEQMFVDLPNIEKKLEGWVKKFEYGWTNNAREITRAWLREGLKPRCITRDLKWGIPVPHQGFEQKVFYVWFDAPFGYISMTKRYTKEYKQWWQPSKGIDVELYQFMAKDNVPFHSVVWPGVLLAINKGHVLVSHIMATEYLNYEDGKFSKSRGIGVFGNDAQETGIPADVWRFYLASARPEGQDSSFSWNDLAARNNSELLNNLGNFINRALVFCDKYYNGTLPEMNLSKEDDILLMFINRELRGYIQSLEKARLRDGIRYLLSISRHGNGYMQTHQPWVLLKGNEQQQARAATVIGLCCNIACLLANLLFPYMPTTARTIFQQLNTKQTSLHADKPYIDILLPSGHKIGKPAPIFTKLEQNFIEEMKKKYSGPQILKTTLTIGELEMAVKAQADKVRQLKASTKDKTVWQPEVNILLNLKKQLMEAQSNQASSTGDVETKIINNSDVN
ncbi:methionine--tRNA ligase, cytoplasmic [Glossina fuscipes]|uniref:Methionine--tRNA ligase, cytoplasmic n=1 Tax=Glossina fuscipes TaxID=7396 RepID=A0A9C6DIT9_9MUSC|nr:methionine--tRNA ligase, cytoplasmic [Glossina fuscipes]